MTGCKIKRDLCSGCSFAPSKGRYRFIMHPLAPSFPVAVYFCTLYQNLSTMPVCPPSGRLVGFEGPVVNDAPVERQSRPRPSPQTRLNPTRSASALDCFPKQQTEKCTLCHGNQHSYAALLRISTGVGPFFRRNPPEIAESGASSDGM